MNDSLRLDRLKPCAINNSRMEEDENSLTDDEMEKLLAILSEKESMLIKINDDIPMNMIAYEYAVLSGADPTVAASIYEVDSLIREVTDPDNKPKQS